MNIYDVMQYISYYPYLEISIFYDIFYFDDFMFYMNIHVEF